MLAEDILQDAFAKVVARPEQAPADEAVVPWFTATSETPRSISFAGAVPPTARTSHLRVRWSRNMQKRLRKTTQMV
ncbi:MAG: hypothetical protein ACRD15_02760 [Vicinamibacterales bacterium]